MKHGPRPSEGSSNNSPLTEQIIKSFAALNQGYKPRSTPSSTSAAATTSPVTLIYHKIDDYYGVLWNGMTMFSGSYDACVAYREMFS